MSKKKKAMKKVMKDVLTVKDLKVSLERYDDSLNVIMMDSEWGAEPVRRIYFKETNSYDGKPCVVLFR